MRDGLLNSLDNGRDLLNNRLCGFSGFSLKTLDLLLGNLHAPLDVCHGIFDFLLCIFDTVSHCAIYSVQCSIC